MNAITFSADISLGIIIQTILLLGTLITGLVKITHRMAIMELKVDTMWRAFKVRIGNPENDED